MTLVIKSTKHDMADGLPRIISRLTSGTDAPPIESLNITEWSIECVFLPARNDGKFASRGKI